MTRLFLRFYHAVIAILIVTLHHGRVAVSESPGGGARFSIFPPAD